MWFKSETEAAQKVVERAVRKLVGRRLIVLVVGFLILAGLAVAAVQPVAGVVPWLESVWYYRVNNAGRYLETVGTAEFFSHRVKSYPQLPGKTQHQIVTLNQAVKFNRSVCTLQITEKRQAKLQWNEDAPTVFRDYTTVTTFHLGSIRDLEITARVKTYENGDATPFHETPYAFHVLVSNDNTNGVRQILTAGRQSDFPMDMVGWIEEFHVLSEEPISKFTDALPYLDRWCGNQKTLERSRFSTSDEIVFGAAERK